MPKMNIAELSNLTGKHRATIKKRLLTVDPLSEESERAKLYETRIVLPMLYQPDFITPSNQADSNVLDLTAERARLAHHQANKYHLESENLKGNLIEADIVQEVWEAQLANLRAKLLTIPTKAAPRAAILDDEKQVVTYLQKLIHDALEELSEYTPEQYRRKGSKTGTRSAGTAADIDGESVGGPIQKAKRRVKR
jgi:phage terminase Nu1 subunit (DNA packaging protein)